MAEVQIKSSNENINKSSVQCLRKRRDRWLVQINPLVINSACVVTITAEKISKCHE